MKKGQPIYFWVTLSNVVSICSLVERIGGNEALIGAKLLLVCLKVGNSHVAYDIVILL